MSGRKFARKKISSINQTPNPLQPRRRKIPSHLIQSQPQEQETASIPEKLDRASRFGYNALDVPVNEPATPPVQKQSASGGLENNSQQQEVLGIEAAESHENEPEEQEQQEISQQKESDTQEPENSIQHQEITDAENAEGAEKQAEIEKKQPQQHSLQARLEKASKFGYNALNVPVNSVSKPAPPLQRKLAFDELDNEYQPEVIERANPVLNSLNHLNVQRGSDGNESSQEEQHQQKPQGRIVQRLCDECAAELGETEEKEKIVQAKSIDEQSSDNLSNKNQGEVSLDIPETKADKSLVKESLPQNLQNGTGVTETQSSNQTNAKVEQQTQPAQTTEPKSEPKVPPRQQKVESAPTAEPKSEPKVPPPQQKVEAAPTAAPKSEPKVTPPQSKVESAPT
ncbi:MAG TPA: hypothetical protein DEG47_30630, partial [Cyanobacteria bacterium UBA11148]|nr:hypothetical protein [Cyanobacteria bacterium UBA11148]